MLPSSTTFLFAVAPNPPCPTYIPTLLLPLYSPSINDILSFARTTNIHTVNQLEPSQQYHTHPPRLKCIPGPVPVSIACTHAAPQITPIRPCGHSHAPENRDQLSETIMCVTNHATRQNLVTALIFTRIDDPTHPPATLASSSYRKLHVRAFQHAVSSLLTATEWPTLLLLLLFISLFSYQPSQSSPSAFEIVPRTTHTTQSLSSRFYAFSFAFTGYI